MNEREKAAISLMTEITFEIFEQMMRLTGHDVSISATLTQVELKVLIDSKNNAGNTLPEFFSSIKN